MNNTPTLTACLFLLTAPGAASAQMTEREKQVYVMAMDPAEAGSEYAVTAAVKKPAGIVIIIPPTVATTVNESGTERDLIADFVRLNFVFTGRMRVLWPPRWFEFEDVNTGERYRFFEKDTTRITALFADGLTVKFKFYGTAIECPAGQCFEYLVGTETKPIIKPPPRKPRPAQPPRPRGGGDHPGKDRGKHAPPPGSGGGGAMPGRPYDPFDERNWPKPRPGRPW